MNFVEFYLFFFSLSSINFHGGSHAKSPFQRFFFSLLLLCCVQITFDFLLSINDTWLWVYDIQNFLFFLLKFDKNLCWVREAGLKWASLCIWACNKISDWKSNFFGNVLENKTVWVFKIKNSKMENSWKIMCKQKTKKNIEINIDEKYSNIVYVDFKKSTQKKIKFINSRGISCTKNKLIYNCISGYIYKFWCSVHVTLHG